ncbi:Epidermal retinol dehydrogenase 2 [Portunus trituberculatus]|uniref:Epidermal retinol dehydrogenase 2 n=1 Tax=Portunus trituberculatus TaxID=210409 RepID=A0A5B7IU08_PORTR|nr:Epidermal retinol dehydrogenase 2 [Portunus trituberculatus]
MRVWEAAAMMLGFIVLNLKAMVLLGLDLFRLLVPPEEKNLAGELVLLILLFSCGRAHHTQVTGAGQNLGRELAVQLSRLGAKLILLDINEVGVESSLLHSLPSRNISPIFPIPSVLLYSSKKTLVSQNVMDVFC